MIPAKRTVEQGENRDDEPSKRPKLDEASLLQTASHAENRAIFTEDQTAPEQPKRSRADSAGDERTSVKRARIADVVLNLVETNEQHRIQAGIGSSVEESVSPTFESDRADNFGNDASDEVAAGFMSDTRSDSSQTSESTSSELGSLVRELKSKSSILLRSQAKLYVRSKEDAECRLKEDVVGSGLWLGTNGIPGTLNRGDNKPDCIELPAKKPQRMVQVDMAGMNDGQGESYGHNASAMPIVVVKPPEVRENSNTSTKRWPRPKKEGRGKQQTRMGKPWDVTAGQSADSTK